MADPKTKPPQCGNCRHSHQAPILAGGTLHCWRYPPTASLVYGQEGPVGVALRPSVNPADICGEWARDERGTFALATPAN